MYACVNISNAMDTTIICVGRSICRYVCVHVYHTYCIEVCVCVCVDLNKSTHWHRTHWPLIVFFRFSTSSEAYTEGTFEWRQWDLFVCIIIVVYLIFRITDIKHFNGIVNHIATANALIICIIMSLVDLSFIRE